MIKKREKFSSVYLDDEWGRRVGGIAIDFQKQFINCQICFLIPVSVMVRTEAFWRI